MTNGRWACTGKSGAAAVLFLSAAAQFSPRAANGQWPQWGGRNRDFSSDAKGLAASWPEAGPAKIWSRPLGQGYSSIAVESGDLYTMYRAGNDEIVVALDAGSGKTLWEQKYPAPLPEGMDPQFGKGPNSTPLIHDGKVYTLGVAGRFQCFDAKTGSPVWSHDLMKDFGAKSPTFGFSCSPLLYKSSLILPVGGPGVGVISFDAAAGAVQWKKHDFVDLYSSPILIQVDGKDQIVLLAGSEAVGMEPGGEIEWRYPFETQFKTNIMTPLFGSDGILFISTGPELGSRGLKISRKDGKCSVEEVWQSRKLQMGQGTAPRVADTIYASGGSDAASFLFSIDAKSGKIGYRERGFSKANVIAADGKIIILDEDGTLAIAPAAPDKLDVKSKAKLLQKPAWTAPTLVGNRLFMRDGETIMALDLGQGNTGT